MLKGQIMMRGQWVSWIQFEFWKRVCNFCRCPHHVISTGCRMLKLVSNLGIYLLFCLFDVSKKSTNGCASFVMKSLNILFLILKVPKMNFTGTVKKHNNKSHLIFNIQRPNLSLINVTCVNLKNYREYLDWNKCTYLYQ